MVENISIKANGSVEGTFKYVTGFTDFSSNPDEQSGYYFPFKLETTGTTMTFKKNGSPTKEDIPFDPELLFRVSQSDTFEVLVDDVPYVTVTFENATFNPVAKTRARKK